MADVRRQDAEIALSYDIAKSNPHCKLIFITDDEINYKKFNSVIVWLLTNYGKTKKRNGVLLTTMAL
jgi:hypothetical protein